MNCPCANERLSFIRLVSADLRLADNPALQAAIERGGPVIPVFIHAPEEEAPWPPGGASRWWLHQSLGRWTQTCARRLEAGPPARAVARDLAALVEETGAGAVFWNRRYEPAVIARDAASQRSLARRRSGGGELQRRVAARAVDDPESKRQTVPGLHAVLEALPRQARRPRRRCPRRANIARAAEAGRSPSRSTALELEPRIKWAEGMRAAWQPGAAGAQAQLKRFLHERVRRLHRRSQPPRSSPAPRACRRTCTLAKSRRARSGTRCAAMPKRSADSRTTWRTSQFLTEIGWREFAHHLLYHFPHTPAEPLRAQLQKISVAHGRGALKAWQKGRTGYPIVDAGMRELWATGWMHNRVRMIVASFLVKDLLLPWTEGARWFWDTLVDADLAQNTLGWQWTAGCGADAAPYFRVFNPGEPGRKVRSARRLCAPLVSRTGEAARRVAASAVAGAAGNPCPRRFATGPGLSRPIVSHAIAREVALEAFAGIRSNTATVVN